MDTILQDLLRTASAHTETIWETVCSIWLFILDRPGEKQEEVFTLFLSRIKLDDVAAGKPDIYFKKIFEFVTQDIDRLADRILQNLIQQNVTEERFYHVLWEKVCDSALLPDQTAQIAFLLRLWVDVRVPYYQIGAGCTMENEEFQAIRKSISSTLKKAYYILAIPFQQKTQRASLLMDLADGLEDRREKAVFWANVIARVGYLQRAISEAKSEDMGQERGTAAESFP